MFSALKTPENLWKIYLCIATITVFALCILMPPFEVNDEFQHFFRSYQVSDGIFIGRARGGIAGGYLPASLSQLVLDIVGSLQLYMPHPVIARPLPHTLSYINVPLQSQDKIFTDFSATVLYSPLSYLPQAFGIWIARLLGSGPLGCFYAARFMNGSIAILLTVYALRIAPFARYALFCTALLPTVLSLDGSASQDASIISAVILFLALCLRSYERGYWLASEVSIAILMGLVFSVSKLAYTPVLLLAYSPIFSICKTKSTKNLIISSGIVLTCILVSLLWVFVTHPLMVWHQNDNYVDLQIEFILAHPLYFLAVLILDVFNMWLLYLRNATSSMVGWPSEIWLPVWTFVIIIMGFLFLPFMGDQQQSSRKKYQYLIFSLFSLSSVSVLFILYLSYEPIGSNTILEAQGRHFIPVIPLFAVFMATLSVDRLATKIISFGRLFLIVAVVVSSFVLVETIIQQYKLL